MKSIQPKRRWLRALLVSLLMTLGTGLVWAGDQDRPSTPSQVLIQPANSPILPSDSKGVNADRTAQVGNPLKSSQKAVDLKALSSQEPQAAKLMDLMARDRLLNQVFWTLMAGFLVMFMQAGFAMVGAGFTQAKNVGHTMAMSFTVYGLGMLGYWISGFALQMGGSGGGPLRNGPGLLNYEVAITLLGKTFGFWGAKGFFLSGLTGYGGIMALFLFQMVLMGVMATIPIGAMAERWNFKSFVVYTFFASILLYPLFANWVWGGGWLSQLGQNFGLGHGFIDYAGSSVVHMTGGLTALAGALVLGPRIGKYKNEKIIAIPGHNIPMAVVGTFILALGWFGFTTGASALGSEMRLGAIAVNTMLASAAGVFSAMLYMWIKFGKPDISIMCNGLLAGLVAISASCAFVTAPSAVLIGLIAGLLVCLSVFFVERTLKIDDPVGAFSIHGVNGAWGVLALGLLADGSYGEGFNNVAGTVKGLLCGAPEQFLAQCLGLLINIIYVFAMSYVFFKAVDKIMGLRVPPEVEIEGLDQAELAVTAYPDFSIRKVNR